tara:strand:- start:79 stop:534 length:456 start_codon:yes stop_codon:yes gene_type:complete
MSKNTNQERCAICNSFISKTKPHECTGYSDREIIELAFINPGYGFAGFCKQLSSHYKMQDRVFELFEEHKAESGLCLFSRLQDPDAMVKVGLLEYYKQEEHLPAGIGRHGKVAGKKGRNPKNPVRKVKLAPEFNWGGNQKKVFYNQSNKTK